MEGEVTTSNSTPASLPLSAIFLFDTLVSPERRRALVGRVLNEFSTLPVGVKNTLRSAVNDEVVPTSGGFRKGQAGRALDRSSFLLHEPLLQSVTSSDIMAGAVLQGWAESHPSLREAVERHLTGRGLTTPGPDLPSKLFRGQWLPDQWDAERESFSLAYTDDFDPEDVGLMMCYVSGNFPPLPHSEGLDTGELTLDDALSAALSSLRELPPPPPTGSGRYPTSSHRYPALSRKKQLSSAGTRSSTHCCCRYAWTSRNCWSSSNRIPKTGSQQGYPTTSIPALPSDWPESCSPSSPHTRPIHDRAPGISEERERAGQRDSLQPSILATLQQMSAMMTGDVPAHPATARRTVTDPSPAAPEPSPSPAPVSSGPLVPAPEGKKKTASISTGPILYFNNTGRGLSHGNRNTACIGFRRKPLNLVPSLRPTLSHCGLRTSNCERVPTPFAPKTRT